ncbi:MAG TPA: universal stress protein [Virgibacillus sp.]|nr:universal stress protein [Virgibacillus sp.]
MRKILVAYDGSLLSRKAIESAKEQVSLLPDTEVHIVAVVENTGPQTSGMISRAMTDEVIEKAREQMDKIEKEFSSQGTSIVTEVLPQKGKENPGKTISTYAKDNKVDLMIAGSRGLGNIKGVFLGSVSAEIVRHSECPVLIIK